MKPTRRRLVAARRKSDQVVSGRRRLARRLDGALLRASCGYPCGGLSVPRLSTAGRCGSVDLLLGCCTSPTSPLRSYSTLLLLAMHSCFLTSDLLLLNRLLPP